MQGGKAEERLDREKESDYAGSREFGQGVKCGKEGRKEAEKGVVRAGIVQWVVGWMCGVCQSGKCGQDGYRVVTSCAGATQAGED